MYFSEDVTKGPVPPTALQTLWTRLKEHPLARVGPGLITGVADDDPSGIATYSQAGAQFGLAMLWTMPLAFPLMAAFNRCARASAASPAWDLRPTSRPLFRRWCCKVSSCCCC